ncbi:MAG: 4Fe-4S dicluster domain-containing protein [Chloroflexi bacterium]|nr:4Fe-4S dicluster domain-containing protein [Chloroflexota bacterium]
MASKRVVLRFPRHLVDQPIIYKLVKDYNLVFNILKASVGPKEEGLMVVELSGDPVDYEKAMYYLDTTGVEIQPLSRDITRNEERCTHCGACVTICPTNAFIVDNHTRKILFDSAKCLACELCLLACPPRAMELRL